jgi:hypothetical protein
MTAETFLGLTRLFLRCAVVALFGLGSPAGAVCQTETDGTLSFTIDPAVAGPILAVVSQPAVKCGVGETFTVQAASANGGGAPAACPTTGFLNDGSGHAIAYTLGCVTGGVGQGTGAAEPAVELGVDGRVDALEYQNAAAGGGYSDRITFQVTY